MHPKPDTYKHITGYKIPTSPFLVLWDSSHAVGALCFLALLCPKGLTSVLPPPLHQASSMRTNAQAVINYTQDHCTLTLNRNSQDQQIVLMLVCFLHLVLDRLASISQPEPKCPACAHTQGDFRLHKGSLRPNPKNKFTKNRFILTPKTQNTHLATRLPPQLSCFGGGASCFWF